MSILDPDVLAAENMVLVQLPSSAPFPVHEEEVAYFQQRVHLYVTEFRFLNISDLQDVDRMTILELMVYRWGQWLTRGKDYFGDPVDLNETQKQFKEYSNELRQLKKLLGIDKLARDKAKGDDSVSAYIASLQRRAKEFGVMREAQLGKALELFQQMSALVTLHKNCDELERREQHITTDDLIEWLRDIAIPEFEQIDAYFRTHSQKMWIRSQ